MKKILLLTVLLNLSFYGFSQDVKYGVRGGYTISHIDFDDSPTMDNKHRNSMYIGFLVNISLSKTLAVMPELQFSGEGAKAESLQLDYIQLPILLKYKIGKNFHAGIGPQIGLKVHKYEDGIRNLAYSAVAGVEYRINYAIFADLRYNYGISNVFDEKLGITAKNRNIQLGVGYKF